MEGEKANKKSEKSRCVSVLALPLLEEITVIGQNAVIRGEA